MDIPEHIRWRDTGEELVLFDEKNGRYGVLNDVGAEVWRGVANRLSQAEVVDALAAKYDGPLATLREDVAAFLEQAVQAGMLVPGEQES